MTEALALVSTGDGAANLDLDLISPIPDLPSPDCVTLFHCLFLTQKDIYIIATEPFSTGQQCQYLADVRGKRKLVRITVPKICGILYDTNVQLPSGKKGTCFQFIFKFSPF